METLLRNFVAPHWLVHENLLDGLAMHGGYGCHRFYRPTSKWLRRSAVKSCNQYGNNYGVELGFEAHVVSMKNGYLMTLIQVLTLVCFGNYETLILNAC